MQRIKKIFSLTLCVLAVLTLLPSAAYGVDTYTTSPEGIAFIKEFEGFSGYPYEFGGSWAVGYGHGCQPEEYPDGISEADAELLLQEDLAQFETIINTFLIQNSVSITQYQFDALIDITYNMGTQWMTSDSRIYSYLISGIEQYTESEVVNAIGAWCHSGSKVLEHVAERRMRDAFLFLYGVYDNSYSGAYTYVHFNTNGGNAIKPSSTVFYPAGFPYGQLPVAVKDGATFTGWYDANGTPVTEDDIAAGPLEVSATWQNAGPSTPDYSAWVNPYSDIAETDWCYSYVRELSANGVMNGYPDGTFLPGQSLKNGEALKLILIAAGKPDIGPSQEGHWAAGYLSMAESLGCIAPGTITDLDAPMDRGTIAQVAAIAMGLAPMEGASPFIDADNGYLLALYEEGIITGSISDGYRWYFPSDAISRAEICAIAARIYGWQDVDPVDPGVSGYIPYRDKYIPVLPSVPVCPYNPDLFVLDGSTMYYHDPAYSTEWGIDVSRHQGDIDWSQVAGAGVQFAMIRLGYRGYGAEGTLNMDMNFEQNYNGAASAGIKVGAYFFSQATSIPEALEEAAYVLEALDGRPLDYPLVCDWETVTSSGARTANVSSSTVTDCVITFCEAIRAAGYTPMIYFNLYDGYERLQLDRLTAYDAWFAQYAKQPTMYYNYRIWQYSDSGSVPGIEGNVDMDLAFIPYG